MKLHLPKSLLLAAVAAYTASGATLTSTTDADGNKLWNVGAYTVDSISKSNYGLPSANVVVYDEEKLTLNNSDKLGIIDTTGTLVSSFGAIKFDDEFKSFTYKYNKISSGTVSNNFKVGTLEVFGSSTVSLGGQYKVISDALSGGIVDISSLLGDDYDEYTGLTADSVLVNGSGASLSSWNATIGSLTVKAGTVDLHTAGDSGYGNKHFTVWDAKDSKQVSIRTGLTVAGGTVTIGKSGGTYLQSAFGTLTYTGDTWYDGTLVSVESAEVHAAQITQTAGTLKVQGDSVSVDGLHINQTGGTMSISNGAYHDLADYGDSVISQNSLTNATLNIGTIRAYNSQYNVIKSKLQENGVSVELSPSVEISHSGNGTINMSGVDFTAEIGSSTQVSTITQDDHVDEVTGAVTATTGTINLAGAYEGATFDITQRAAGGTISLSGTMSAGTVNQTAGTLSVKSSGAMTVDSMSVGGTVTNDGTIEGQITVKGGTLVNKGLIGQAPVNPSSEEGADVAALSTTDDMLVTIASGKVQNYGTITQDISVKGGTLTLEQGAQVLGVALEAGNINVIGSNVTTGALTLNGGTITFMEGATITLADGANVTIDGATIVVNVSDAALADLKNGAQYTLFNTTSDVTAIEGTTMTFVATGSGEQVEAVVSHEGAGNLSIATIVPEPTTATLSLLALAALAARRRRK